MNTEEIVNFKRLILVCGVLNLAVVVLGFVIPFIAHVVVLVINIIAHLKIRKYGLPQKCAVFSYVAIVTNLLFMVLFLVAAIIVFAGSIESFFNGWSSALDLGYALACVSLILGFLVPTGFYIASGVLYFRMYKTEIPDKEEECRLLNSNGENL
ncbi:MAG: hypothetical protein FWG87_14885 [Defluviitaleaceae bacterium]|nr:hypothetical protein [Defluviitaleaceae bacterium]